MDCLETYVKKQYVRNQEDDEEDHFEYIHLFFKFVFYMKLL